jgi:hypothetical protein
MFLCLNTNARLCYCVDSQAGCFIENRIWLPRSPDPIIACLRSGGLPLWEPLIAKSKQIADLSLAVNC